MKVLFLVEGQEKTLVEQYCGKAAEFAPIDGGQTVSAGRLAETCYDIIRASKGFDLYVIWSDLDKRQVKEQLSSLDFENLVSRDLMRRFSDAERGHYQSRIIFSACDREFENWLLASVSGQNMDGQKCRAALTEILGHPYSKRLDGLRLYKQDKIKLSYALASASFRRFAEQIPKGICPKIDNALAGQT